MAIHELITYWRVIKKRLWLIGLVDGSEPLSGHAAHLLFVPTGLRSNHFIPGSLLPSRQRCPFVSSEFRNGVQVEMNLSIQGMTLEQS